MSKLFPVEKTSEKELHDFNSFALVLGPQGKFKNFTLIFIRALPGEAVVSGGRQHLQAGLMLLCLRSQWARTQMLGSKHLPTHPDSAAY